MTYANFPDFSLTIWHNFKILWLEKHHFFQVSSFSSGSGNPVVTLEVPTDN